MTRQELPTEEAATDTVQTMPASAPALAELMPSFVDEVTKEAGLKDIAKKIPALAKKLPEAGKALNEKATLTAYKLQTKYPSVYRELHDPTNYPGPFGALKKFIDGH
jgi:hypothetical protein